MTPGARLNLGLALLVAVLGGLVLWGTWRQQGPATPPLTGLDPSRIQHVRLHRDDLSLSFTRTPRGWRSDGRNADGAKLEALCRLAAAPSLRRFPAELADPAELGLAPPALVLELDDLSLEFGATEPIRQRRYVRHGDTVHLIDDRHQHLLLAPADVLVPGVP